MAMIQFLFVLSLKVCVVCMCCMCAHSCHFVNVLLVCVCECGCGQAQSSSRQLRGNPHQLPCNHTLGIAVPSSSRNGMTRLASPLLTHASNPHNPHHPSHPHHPHTLPQPVQLFFSEVQAAWLLPVSWGGGWGVGGWGLQARVSLCGVDDRRGHCNTAPRGPDPRLIGLRLLQLETSASSFPVMSPAQALSYKSNALVARRKIWLVYARDRTYNCKTVTYDKAICLQYF